MRTNNSDYAIAYTGLRTQAKAHGLDPNDETLLRFLRHTAEVMAQDRVALRCSERLNHKLIHQE